MNLAVALFLSLAPFLAQAAGRCVIRSYGHGSGVCVCDGDQCGALGVTQDAGTYPPSANVSRPFAMYTTTKAGLRLQRTDGNFDESYASGRPPPRRAEAGGTVDDHEDPRQTWTSQQGAGRLTVDDRTTYQAVDGFGGALTDSAAMNILKLSPRTRDALMRALFGAEGNAYSLVRVPMAGTDDSVRKYTYADAPSDVDLKGFRLADEDIRYKIPVLLNASALVAGQGLPELRVMASAWTAPPWMKSNGNFVSGMLRRDMYQPWAEYHIRFLREYRARGVRVWALTTGNEPINAFFAPLIIRFNSMGWTPLSQREWVGRHLGPTLRSSAFNDTLLLALDDQRVLLPWWLDILFRDRLTRSYVDGVAVHWYLDLVDPSIGLDFTHDHFPEKFVISTEASSADKPWELYKVQLGSWERAERYMRDIMKDMNHWVTGWMEWSLALDMRGGPSWSRNFVDVSVIVDADRDQFLLQPTYFAMAHFSRFVPRGSVRVRLQLQLERETSAEQQGLSGLSGRSTVDAIAFRTPANRIVVIMHNSGNSDTSVTVRDHRFGVARVLLTARSFNTLVYDARDAVYDAVTVVSTTTEPVDTAVPVDTTAMPVDTTAEPNSAVSTTPNVTTAVPANAES